VTPVAPLGSGASDGAHAEPDRVSRSPWPLLDESKYPPAATQREAEGQATDDRLAIPGYPLVSALAGNGASAARLGAAAPRGEELGDQLLLSTLAGRQEILTTML
jgi:hypothetical protein